MLVGLTASHTRSHVIRAILEGVAFSLRDTFTIFKEINVPVKTIRLGGGGALGERLSGGRFKRTFTDKKSRRSRQKKALPTGLQF